MPITYLHNDMGSSLTNTQTNCLNNDYRLLSILLDRFESLLPSFYASGKVPRQVSKEKYNQLKAHIEKNYVFFYWVESYSYAVDHYNDAQGDYINSDSETIVFERPMEQMIQHLTLLNIKDAELIIDKRDIHRKFINLYYGESIVFHSIAIPIIDKS